MYGDNENSEQTNVYPQWNNMDKFVWTKSIKNFGLTFWTNATNG